MSVLSSFRLSGLKAVASAERNISIAGSIRLVAILVNFMPLLVYMNKVQVVAGQSSLLIK